ncbi:vWA domain-containing protein [Cryptosporangium phraense]|uniref:VWA domain-containing protein n=1 Tax=Cryptosporangium phraense TaxID=2593070 RepID=A0A545AXC7_9ACTN|nr:substrate-binding domain-containing protein [Cryptosporangium phraense]TQS45986.1 VWA domain-containing protein [Cryptosporangium phraense]
MTTGRPGGPPPWRWMVAYLLAAFAIGGPAAATDPPNTRLLWTLLVVASLLGALAATDAMDRAVRRLVRLVRAIMSRNPDPRPRPPWWLRLPRPVRAIGLPAVVLVLALVIGVLAVPKAREGGYYLIRGCQPPPTLRVLTTPESLATTSALATEYERESAAAHHGCASADVYVYAADPAAARDALINGWTTESLQEVGPRPEVWMPDSTVDAGRVAELGRTAGASPVESARSIASTPIVLAAPAQAAPQADEPRTWAQLLRDADDARLPVVRPQPTRSTTGEVATELIYRSLSEDAEEYDATATRAVERQIGDALDRGRYTLGNADAVLCRHRDASQAGTAVVLTEQQLVRYNQGRPHGENCPSEDPVQADRQLVAVYPRDTAGLDHPLVRLRWPRTTERQRGATQAWSDWLGSEAGRRALVSIGLRPPVGGAGTTPLTEPLTPRWGVRPDAVFDRASPPSADVDAALDAYTAASRPARTLVLLDSSGSMATRAGPGTRFDAARSGVRSAFGTVGPRDQVGLWTFPADPGTTRPLLGIRAWRAGTAGPAADRALKKIRPADGTPLYRSIEAGLDALGRPAEGQVTTLIVITDGEDSDQGTPPDPRVLADRASAVGVRISVVALGDASCAGPALSVLTGGSGGDCENADSRTLGGALVDLLET